MSIWQTKSWQEMLLKSKQIEKIIEIDNIFIEKRSIWLGQFWLFVLWIDILNLNNDFLNKVKSLCKIEKSLFIQFENIDYTSSSNVELTWFTNNYYKKFITPFTAIIDLNLSLDEILSMMKPKWRYNIKLAEKNSNTQFIFAHLGRLDALLDYAIEMKNASKEIKDGEIWPSECSPAGGKPPGSRSRHGEDLCHRGTLSQAHHGTVLFRRRDTGCHLHRGGHGGTARPHPPSLRRSSGSSLTPSAAASSRRDWRRRSVISTRPPSLPSTVSVRGSSRKTPLKATPSSIWSSLPMSGRCARRSSMISGAAIFMKPCRKSLVMPFRTVSIPTISMTCWQRFAHTP